MALKGEVKGAQGLNLIAVMFICVVITYVEEEKRFHQAQHDLE
jgi:hypothetical protein